MFFLLYMIGCELQARATPSWQGNDSIEGSTLALEQFEVLLQFSEFWLQLRGSRVLG